MRQYLLLMMVLGVFGSVQAGFEVLENSATRLVFRWTADTIVQENAKVVVSPANTEMTRSGISGLSAYAVSFALPPVGEAVISISPGPVRTLPLSHSGRSAEPQTSVDPTPAFYGPWLAYAPAGSMGRLRVQQIVIAPVDIVDNQTCRVLTEAVVTVVLPPARAGGVLADNEYYGSLERALVNFKHARNWGVVRPLRKITADFPLQSTAVMATFTVGDGHSGYNETGTSENGLLALSGAQLKAVLGTDVRVDRLALYGGRKQELPIALPGTGGVVPEGIERIALLPIDKNGNGILDADDQVIAYVSGTSDWYYDSLTSRFRFALNRYDDYRRYWLVLSTGAVAPIGKFVQPDGPGQLVDHFTDRVRIKGYNGLQSFPGDSRKGTIDWIWQRLSPSRLTTSTFSLNLAHVAAAFPATVVVSTRVRYGSGKIDAFMGGTKLIQTGKEFAVEPNKWGNGNLNFSLQNSTDTVEIDYADVVWQRDLELASGEQLFVYSDDTALIAQYVVSGLPEGELSYLFRIVDSESAIQLVDTVRNPQSGSYGWIDSAGAGVRYCIASESSLYRQAQGLQRWQPVQSTLFSSDRKEFLLRDLRPPGNRVDYLIVTHDDFLDEALRLAKHKKDVGRFAYPRVARIDDIYREFSGGSVDPTALRNFLAHARFAWSSDELSHVVLMGHGHWDYKQILPQTKYPVYLPVFQVSELFGLQVCAEDHFSQLGSTFADVFLGRIPCKTAMQAAHVVDKIVELESPASADFGAWRNRILLVSDDDRQGPEQDRIVHYTSSEKVADTVLALRPSVDLRKVYLFEYPANDLYEKPAAGQALINEINSGVALINYFGHGAGDVWADEHILLSGSINKMTNTGRYPMINSFSCSVGKFDDPREVSLSENLVLAAQAGAIATVSATREAWATENERLAVTFYSLLHEPNNSRSIGEAYMLARQDQKSTRNLRAYALLGDPSIRYLKQTHTVDLTVSDAADKQGEALDSLMALQKVVVSGVVKGMETGSADAQYGVEGKSAFVQVGLYNPPTAAQRKDGFTGALSYTLPGTPLFAGKVPVVRGRFSQIVLVPRNVAFNKEGVRLTAYAWQGGAAGLGIAKELVFSGTVSDTVSDSSGPSISLRPLYDDPAQNSQTSYTSRLTVAQPSKYQPLTLEVKVFDENGVDVVGVGPDEGLTIEIPGVLQKRNLNHTFQFLEGEYRQGSATLVMEEGSIREGEYRIEMTAQDLLGNITRRSFALTVVATERMDLTNVFNYPNPVRMGASTRFYYHTPVKRLVYQTTGVISDDLDVVIKVFTLSGKPVRTFLNPVNGVRWDLTDEFGKPLSPNVYLYQVKAWSKVGAVQEKTSRIMKLVIHPPAR